tara:strand:- start:5964 stop:6299 length:336 start_codon:yes stop_codon:yes gene_type:complete
MKINIDEDMRRYAKSRFPDLKVLQKAFDTVGKMKDLFNPVDIERALPRLSSEQVEIVFELLVYTYDDDEPDFEIACALNYKMIGYEQSPNYEAMTQCIYDNLRAHPNPFSH